MVRSDVFWAVAWAYGPESDECYDPWSEPVHIMATSKAWGLL